MTVITFSGNPLDRASDKRRVVIPMHGSKDLKLGTLRGIIQDMGLTIEEFTAKL